MVERYGYYSVSVIHTLSLALKPPFTSPHPPDLNPFHPQVHWSRVHCPLYCVLCICVSVYLCICVLLVSYLIILPHVCRVLSLPLFPCFPFPWSLSSLFTLEMPALILHDSVIIICIESVLYGPVRSTCSNPSPQKGAVLVDQ